jgi:hypothetical protein
MRSIETPTTATLAPARSQVSVPLASNLLFNGRLLRGAQAPLATI